MMLRQRQRRRPGAVLVESALIYPVMFLVMLGIILLGTAVFRYQQVAHIAREASRWAAVHGAKYAQENKTTAATPQDVYDKVIVPQAAGMNPSAITYQVTWDQTNAQYRSIVTYDANGQGIVLPRSNFVSVTVTYTWNTGLFGTIPVSSTSVMPMSY